MVCFNGPMGRVGFTYINKTLVFQCYLVSIGVDAADGLYSEWEFLLSYLHTEFRSDTRVAKLGCNMNLETWCLVICNRKVDAVESHALHPILRLSLVWFKLRSWHVSKLVTYTSRYGYVRCKTRNYMSYRIRVYLKSSEVLVSQKLGGFVYWFSELRYWMGVDGRAFWYMILCLYPIMPKGNLFFHDRNGFCFKVTSGRARTVELRDNDLQKDQKRSQIDFGYRVYFWSMMVYIYSYHYHSFTAILYGNLT